jgi:hypothetical protein
MEQYTMADIDAMIDKSERQFATGQYFSLEEACAHRKAHLTKLLVRNN